MRSLSTWCESLLGLVDFLLMVGNAVSPVKSSTRSNVFQVEFLNLWSHLLSVAGESEFHNCFKI